MDRLADIAVVSRKRLLTVGGQRHAIDIDRDPGSATSTVRRASALADELHGGTADDRSIGEAGAHVKQPSSGVSVSY